MPTTCAAAFNPKVWTYAAAPRKTEVSEPHRWRGSHAPALPFAQRAPRLPPPRREAKIGNDGECGPTRDGQSMNPFIPLRASQSGTSCGHFCAPWMTRSSRTVSPTIVYGTI